MMLLISRLMRFLELMQIWRFSGIYIYVIVKMLRAMIPLLLLLVLPLVAFGTLREGIMTMNRTEVTLEGIKNILLEPYFMLYGEVYAPEIDRELNAAKIVEITYFWVMYLVSFSKNYPGTSRREAG